MWYINVGLFFVWCVVILIFAILMHLWIRVTPAYIRNESIYDAVPNYINWLVDFLDFYHIRNMSEVAGFSLILIMYSTLPCIVLMFTWIVSVPVLLFIGVVNLLRYLYKKEQENKDED